MFDIFLSEVEDCKCPLADVIKRVLTFHNINLKLSGTNVDGKIVKVRMGLCTLVLRSSLQTTGYAFSDIQVYAKQR